MSESGSNSVRQTTGTNANSSSVTTTQTIAQSNDSSPVLVLRASPTSNDRKVSFDDSVVDNEFLNRKKSKVCCIFHKARRPGVVDSDSETDSESEGENTPNQYEREPRYVRKKRTSHCNHH